MTPAARRRSEGILEDMATGSTASSPDDGRSSTRPSCPSGVFTSFANHSSEGMAWADESGVVRWVNPAMCRSLGLSERDILGRVFPFGGALASRDADGVVARTVAEGGTMLHVRDARTARRERQVTAFANTAAMITREGTLETVLNRLAAEVRRATGMATCAVVLLDGPDDELRYVGHSGLPDDYIERFQAARRNGAVTVTSEAFTMQRTVVSRQTRQRVLGDERWAPTHAMLENSDWDTFVATPLVVRGRAIGALNGFHHRGHEPEDADIRFLNVMADHAAIAVDNARMLASLKLRAAEAERARLARDLHDSVSQALFSLSLQARGIELSTAERHDAELAEQLTELRELAQGALGEMRSLIQHRRPVELRDEGLVLGLQRLATATTQRSGLPIELDLPTEVLTLDKHLEEDLFRLVQEALNNVVKHSGAMSAALSVEFDDNSLVVEVRDDGVGVALSSSDRDGFGMSTMRERAERHGGHVEVLSRSGQQGTVVRATFARRGGAQ